MAEGSAVFDFSMVHKHQFVKSDPPFLCLPADGYCIWVRPTSDILLNGISFFGFITGSCEYRMKFDNIINAVRARDEGEEIPIITVTGAADQDTFKVVFSKPIRMHEAIENKLIFSYLEEGLPTKSLRNKQDQHRYSRTIGRTWNGSTITVKTNAPPKWQRFIFNCSHKNSY